MMIRAFYYYGHAFQFTDSNTINAAIGFFAIFWAFASVFTGLILYKKRKMAAGIMLVPLLLSLNSEVIAQQRIVSLAPSCTEIVAGLGLQQNLVGITNNTDYPPEVLHLPVVGSYVDLNLEAILSLQPDVIVGTSDGNPPEILQRLRDLKMQIAVLNLTTYRNIQDSILQLGKMLDHEKEARQIVSQMQQVSDCIHKKTAGVMRPSVLFVYESYPIVTAGKNTFTDELIQMAGGRSITHEVIIQYPRLTIENIIARDPEVIIESSMDPNAEMKLKVQWWKQYPMICAVKNNRVYILPSKNLDRPSQRIVIGLQQLSRTLHPDLFATDTCLEQEP
jgi:iron complex transport system substrate-binding protein